MIAVLNRQEHRTLPASTSSRGSLRCSTSTMKRRDDLYQVIGRNLATARERVGMTQIELGSELGVSGPAVARWESGENRIEIAQLRRAADVLGMPIAVLLGEEPLSVEAEFAHELHRLSPADRLRALANMRALRETAKQLGEQPPV